MASPIGKAILSVLGVFNSGVNVVNFLPNQMPNRDFDFLPADRRDEGPQNSMVRVQLALNGYQGLSQAEGDTPNIVAFDDNKEYIGASNWWDGDGKIGSGGYMDIWVFQRKGPSRPATYIQVLGHNNGVCVAYVSQIQADGTPRGWLGDMGRACGRRWYYNNVEVGDSGHKPDCVWLNRDGSRDGTEAKGTHNEAAAMQIHMEDFTNFTTAYNTDTNYYCNEPAMIWVDKFDYRIGLYTKEQFDDYLPGKERIHFWTAKDAMKANKRKRNIDLGPRRKPALRQEFENRLTTSVHAKHTASGLCGDENSHGPDFVSFAEGAFCDMRTRRVWPLCKQGVEGEGECYDVEARGLRSGGRLVKRSYVQVENWE